jgi:hypothetical protein
MENNSEYPLHVNIKPLMKEGAFPFSTDKYIISYRTYINLFQAQLTNRATAYKLSVAIGTELSLPLPI